MSSSGLLGAIDDKDITASMCVVYHQQHIMTRYWARVSCQERDKAIRSYAGRVRVGDCQDNVVAT